MSLQLVTALHLQQTISFASKVNYLCPHF